MTVNKLKELVKLNDKNLDKTLISSALGISRPTLYQYLTIIKNLNIAYTDIKSLKDSEIKELFGIDKIVIPDKYKTLSEKFPYFLSELSKTGVTLTLLWEEYKKDYPDGYGYSQFCEHFSRWKKSEKELSMVMNHKPGDKMFVDFAGKKMHITDKETGKETPVETFLAILGNSELTYAQAVLDQKKETFAIVTGNAFNYFGGVTNAIVPDCLKSAVTKPDRYEPDINPLYKDFSEHYGTIILPARPYHPKDKPLAENAVKLSYQRIYAPLRNQVFYSLEELNQAIKEKLELHNNKPMQRLGVSRKELFEKTEKNCLKPLPTERYEIKKYLELKVGFNYHIDIREDKRYYSVPYQYKGKQVKVILSYCNVEIFYDNQRIALHQRVKEVGYTTVKEHMPESHKFQSEWNSERLIDWSSSIGENCNSLIKNILEKAEYPEQAFKTCLGIINLKRFYGEKRLDKASLRALNYGCVSYKSVKSILEKGLDRCEEEEYLFNKKAQLPEHGNLRGGDYYSKGGEIK